MGDAVLRLRWAVPSVCSFAGGRSPWTPTSSPSAISRLWRTPIPAPGLVLARPERVLPLLRFALGLRRGQGPSAAARSAAARSAGPCTLHALLRKTSASRQQHRSRLQQRRWRPSARGPHPHAALLRHGDPVLASARARALGERGRAHWFDGKVLPHPRADLAALFDRYFDEALASGRRLDDYRNPRPFRPRGQEIERHHRGNPRHGPDSAGCHKS